jgi:CheY-like chemotaxis protein
VAKILVADDNSNVQKTMALALADLGVEVLSVNNGEAAVRKLADISPDLVLADIFMPVRNGYEVCEYIKKDPRFAHVPVILLVGAFDPLDEREAQRVGADGILKKPFVPPDPLISMVKTLLERSMSERLVTVSASKAPAAVQVKARSGSAPEVHVPPSPAPEELAPEAEPAPVGRVTFGEGDRPVAFGQLLEPTPRSSTGSGTGVIEPVDDEQILTSSRDTNLGEPVFWRNDPPEAEVEAEAEHSSDGEDDLSVHKWGQTEDSSPPQQDAAVLRPDETVEPLELIREEDEISVPSHVDSGPIELDQAAQASLTVQPGRAPELAANPLEWLATAPAHPPEVSPEASLSWDDQHSGGIQKEPEPEPFPGEFKVEPPPFSISEVHPVEPVTPAGGLKVPARPAGGEPAPASGGLPFGSPSNKKEPALTPDTFKPINVALPAQHSEFAVEPEIREANKVSSKISERTPLVPPSAQAPEDTARSVPIRKWAEMTDSLEERASEIVTRRDVPVSAPSTPAPAAVPASYVPTLKPWQVSKPDAQPAPGGSFTTVPTNNRVATPNSAESATQVTPSPESSVPDPKLVDAVVQRVLDKMRPQVVDIITKEFLRPVVQALVHREIEKK